MKIKIVDRNKWMYTYVEPLHRKYVNPLTFGSDTHIQAFLHHALVYMYTISCTYLNSVHKHTCLFGPCPGSSPACRGPHTGPGALRHPHLLHHLPLLSTYLYVHCTAILLLDMPHIYIRAQVYWRYHLLHNSMHCVWNCLLYRRINFQ